MGYKKCKKHKNIKLPIFFGGGGGGGVSNVQIYLQ